MATHLDKKAIMKMETVPVKVDHNCPKSDLLAVKEIEVIRISLEIVDSMQTTMEFSRLTYNLS
jgi:hypothetical protein